MVGGAGRRKKAVGRPSRSKFARSTVTANCGACLIKSTDSQSQTEPVSGDNSFKSPPIPGNFTPNIPIKPMFELLRQVTRKIWECTDYELSALGKTNTPFALDEPFGRTNHTEKGNTYENTILNIFTTIDRNSRTGSIFHRIMDIDRKLTMEMKSYPLAPKIFEFCTGHNMDDLVPMDLECVEYKRMVIRMKKTKRFIPLPEPNDKYGGMLTHMLNLGCRFINQDGRFIPAEPCELDGHYMKIDILLKECDLSIVRRALHSCIWVADMHLREVDQLLIRIPIESLEVEFDEWKKLWSCVRNSNLKNILNPDLEFGLCINTTKIFQQFLEEIETKPDFICFNLDEDDEDDAQFEDFCDSNEIDIRHDSHDHLYYDTRKERIGCLIKRNLIGMRETYLARYEIEDEFEECIANGYVNGFVRNVGEFSGTNEAKSSAYCRSKSCEY